MATKRKIVWIPSFCPTKLIHLSYNIGGSYAIRDFVNPARTGKTADILPLISWEMEAKGYDSVSISDVKYWKKRLENLSQDFFLNMNSGNSINLQDSEPIISSSKSKAEKHTSILCQIEDICKYKYPNYQTYLTVYRTGGSAIYYEDAEKKTNRTYYHLKMYDKNKKNVKNPDIIFVEQELIQFVIEVKWGFLENYPDEQTDLTSIFVKKELNEIIDMVENADFCTVNGPYVQKGVDVKGSESFEFKVYDNTKFLVVSDLKGLHDSNFSTFSTIKQQYENYSNLLNICDIKEHVDTFYSFEEFIKLI